MKSQPTHTLKVKNRIEETSDAVSFIFEIPEALRASFKYHSGQFVTLFLNVNGEELRRSYSLSTAPEVDRDFQITVKRVPDGRGSNFLCDQVFEGDHLEVTPPSGFFFRPERISYPCHFFLFAAGSGITPIFSILKHALSAHPENQVSLLFANRNQNQIIYSQQLEDYQKANSDRLEITLILSQPHSPWEGPSGRCTEVLVKNFYNSQLVKGEEHQVFTCGPSGFMDLVTSALHQIPVDENRIHLESFGDGPQPKIEQNHFDESGKVLIGDPSAPIAAPETLKAIINNEEIEIPIEPNLSILENLIEAGHNPPYSCMDGACMACMAKIKTGRIYQEDPGILTEENIEAGEVLTCQARALTKIVEVDYDDL
ncbi:MAG: ferredoxin--NADP reductase [Bdellovibrionales bacterium]|nr:ferredoxin--NADP reductase [Bdellovibrionales bacterium]